VAASIRAGIFNDLGSGSNVDLCIITKDGKEYLRNYETPNERTYHAKGTGFHFPRGTAPVLRSEVIPLSMVEVLDGVDAMEA